jgi:2OG-Fe(II) oxygenase superfamily
MTMTTAGRRGRMPLPRFEEAGRPPHVGRCTPTDVVVLGGSDIAAVRVEEFFTAEAAQALSDHLMHRLVYERDEIDDQKRTSRAARTGDLPGSPLRVLGSSTSDPLAEAALNAFTSEWLIAQLACWMGLPLRVLRPPSPYRMDPGDYVRPHDDRAAPEFRLSLAYCLTPEDLGSKGGETVVGLVESVSEYEHPDFFFPLKRWSLQPGAHVMPPVFNSVLMLVLTEHAAHEVREVAEAPRYSITTLYGDGTAG